MKETIKIILFVLCNFILMNTILYLIGSFVALDFDIRNWYIFKESVGRIVLVGIFFAQVQAIYNLTVEFFII